MYARFSAIAEAHGKGLLFLNYLRSKLHFMSTSILDTARALPLSERIELVDALWESIIQDGYEPDPITAQLEELDRRLAAHEKNPDDVVAWEKVKADLESKYGKS